MKKEEQNRTLTRHRTISCSASISTYQQTRDCCLPISCFFCSRDYSATGSTSDVRHPAFHGSRQHTAFHHRLSKDQHIVHSSNLLNFYLTPRATFSPRASHLRPRCSLPARRSEPLLAAVPHVQAVVYLARREQRVVPGRTERIGVHPRRERLVELEERGGCGRAVDSKATVRGRGEACGIRRMECARLRVRKRRERRLQCQHRTRLEIRST